MSYFGEWLLGILRELVQSWLDAILKQAQWFWEALLELLNSGLIVGIIQSGEVIFNQIPPSVWFFMNACQVPMGIVMIFTAYGIRFLIRRIPIIG